MKRFMRPIPIAIAVVLLVALLFAGAVWAQSVPTYGFAGRYIAAFPGAGVVTDALLGPFCKSVSGGMLTCQGAEPGNAALTYDLGDIAFSNPPDDLTSTEKSAVRSAIGFQTSDVVNRRGAWGGNAAYSQGDLVSYNGEIYYCIADVAAIAPPQLNKAPSADAAHWAHLTVDAQQQADWAETNTAAADYIRNKPVLLALSDIAPEPLGTAAPGDGARASREDHVHAAQTIPQAATATPEQSGSSGAVGSSTRYAREDHRHQGDGSGGGGVTLTDDAVLDLADGSRDSGDRRKALGTSATDEDALALLDIPDVPDAPANQSEQRDYALRVPATTGAATWTLVTDEDTTYTFSAPLSESSGAVSIANATSSAAGAMSAADKAKLDGIDSGAEVNVQSDWDASSGDAAILNKPTIPTVPARAGAFTAADETKLDGIEAEAEKNVHLAGAAYAGTADNIVNAEYIPYTDRAGTTVATLSSFQWADIKRVKIHRYGSDLDPEDANSDLDAEDSQPFFQRMLQEGVAEVFIQRYDASNNLITTSDVTLLLEPIAYTSNVLDAYVYQVKGSIATADTPSFRLSFRLPARYLRELPDSGPEKATAVPQAWTLAAQTGAVGDSAKYAAENHVHGHAAIDIPDAEQIRIDEFKGAIDVFPAGNWAVVNTYNGANGQFLITDPTGDPGYAHQVDITFINSAGVNQRAELDGATEILAEDPDGDYAFITVKNQANADNSPSGFRFGFDIDTGRGVDNLSVFGEDAGDAIAIYVRKPLDKEFVQIDGQNVNDELRTAIQGINESETLASMYTRKANSAVAGEWYVSGTTFFINVVKDSADDTALNSTTHLTSWLDIGIWRIRPTANISRSAVGSVATFTFNYAVISGTMPGLDISGEVTIEGADVHRGELIEAAFRDNVGTLAHQYLRTTGADKNVTVESPISNLSGVVSGEKKMATAGAVKTYIDAQDSDNKAWVGKRRELRGSGSQAYSSAQSAFTPISVLKVYVTPDSTTQPMRIKGSAFFARNVAAGRIVGAGIRIKKGTGSYTGITDQTNSWQLISTSNYHNTDYNDWQSVPATFDFEFVPGTTDQVEVNLIGFLYNQQAGNKYNDGTFYWNATPGYTDPETTFGGSDPVTWLAVSTYEGYDGSAPIAITSTSTLE